MDTRRTIAGLFVLPELEVTDYKQQPVYRGHAEQAVALLESDACLARLPMPEN
jgi:hypothetical protein